MSTGSQDRIIGPHPCFEAKHSREVIRIHLPVAAACNIRCAYCNPREDCVHESGPGATSAVISSDDALARVITAAQGARPIGVIGIAGPGDPLANPATFETLEKVANWASETQSPAALCVSTNGLALESSVARLHSIGVRHLTVTVNALDPQIGAQILSFVVKQGSGGGPRSRLTGLEASRTLIARQLSGIRAAVSAGMTVKVNTVLIPQVNGEHIEAIAEKMKSLGVVRMNVMPLIPRAALLAALPPSADELEAARARVMKHLPVMRHCGQCRADAVGLLSEISEKVAVEPLAPAAPGPAPQSSALRVAVATSGSGLVDRHFGQVDHFEIWEATQIPGSKPLVRYLETRNVAKYCQGPADCAPSDGSDAVSTVADCALVLCVRIGHRPQQLLNSQGIASSEVFGPIAETVSDSVLAASGPFGAARVLRSTTRRPGTGGRIGRIRTKMAIAHMLVGTGMTELEVGTPIMGRDEAAAIEAIVRADLGVRVIGRGRALKEDIDAALSCGEDSSRSELDFVMEYARTARKHGLPLPILRYRRG